MSSGRGGVRYRMPPDIGCKFVFFLKVIVLKFEIRKKKNKSS